MQNNFGLDLSFSHTDPTFDGRHRPMASAYVMSDDGALWQPVDPGRGLNTFQELYVASGDLFYLRLFSNDAIDDGRPVGLVFSSRPAIEVAGQNQRSDSPFDIGANISFDQKSMPVPQKDQVSAGLGDQRFDFMWTIGPVAFLSMQPGETMRFEILAEIRVMIDGAVFDFKVDPELVVRGDSV